MIEIILASHSQLATGLVATGKMICGLAFVKDVYTLSLQEDDTGIEDFRLRAETLANKLKDKDVLILTDMFGATPFNVCSAAFHKVNHQIITGMNLPIVLEALMQKESEDLDAYTASVLAAGHQGVQQYRMQEGIQGEEEDIFT